jgi:hypothetical protein
MILEAFSVAWSKSGGAHWIFSGCRLLYGNSIQGCPRSDKRESEAMPSGTPSAPVDVCLRVFGHKLLQNLRQRINEIQGGILIRSD